MPKLVSTQDAIRARLSGLAANKYDDGTPISRRPPSAPEATSEPQKPDPLASLSTLVEGVMKSLSGATGTNQEMIARLEQAVLELKEMHLSTMHAIENQKPEEWQFTWQTDRAGNRVGLRAKQIK